MSDDRERVIAALRRDDECGLTIGVITKWSGLTAGQANAALAELQREQRVRGGACAYDHTSYVYQLVTRIGEDKATGLRQDEAASRRPR